MPDPLLLQFAADERARNLAATTIRNRDSHLRSLATRTGKSLLEMELLDLRLYLGREGIAAGTRRAERASFLAFYTFLQDEGLRTDNPAARLGVISVPKGEPRPFSPEQIDAMLHSGAYTKTRAMILVGYYQGFRVSQIARVHGSDVDLLAGTIRTVSKGGKTRHLPLHPVVAELSRTMPAQAYWFPARKDPTRPMKAASVTNLVTEAKKRAGITDPGLTPHSLRHAFGSDLADNDVDTRVIQELMCHEDLGTTQIYTRVSRRRKQEGIVTLPSRQIPTRSGRATQDSTPAALRAA